MENIITILNKNLNQAELFSIAQSLNKSYKTFMRDGEVWKLISTIIPTESFKEIKRYKSNIVGHKIVNKIISYYYPGEKIIKYNFIKKYINRDDEILLFEMNTDSSRLDLGRINGKSYAYEIKTELDNLKKLNKQINDYSKVFEYIYVITSEKHLSKVYEIIPDYCGIVLYQKKNHKYDFEVEKDARLNKNIEHKYQIKCLSSKDLSNALKTRKIKNKEIPNTRAKKEDYIIDNFKKEEINNLFKMGVKKKFEKRWESLCNDFNSIEPVDVQAFFNSNIAPKWIYYKNSSMV